MKSVRQTRAVTRLEFWEYNAKCATGVAIGFAAYQAFPQYSGQLVWVLISILLSITHDNNSQVAFDRMKGNVVGSLVGFLAFFTPHTPRIFTVCGGVLATIAICFRLKLIPVARTALAAFIIVVLYEGEHGSWEGAVYRMISVVVGCLIGLVINYAFRKLVFRLFPPTAKPEVKGIEKEEKPDGGE